MDLVFPILDGGPNIHLKRWEKVTQPSGFKTQREQLFQRAYPGKLMLKRSFFSFKCVTNLLL